MGALTLGWLMTAPATRSHAQPAASAPAAEQSVDLTPSQLNAIKIEPVGTASFSVNKEAVGNISFDDELSLPVFPQYPGKIARTFAELGDTVRKGQPLYSINSPDLIQAESTLIGAAATLNLTDKALARVKDLFGTNGVSQREMEQAISDQQTAQGALAAARSTVGLFGKTDEEIDQIVAKRSVDPALIVRSPIDGRITFKDAPPGLLVQPGTAPAPYSLADLSKKWMLASLTEGDSVLCRAGQPVEASVMAYPGRVFKGTVAKVYDLIDPNTHRTTVRTQIDDPKNELRPGMLATFEIEVQPPARSTALPVNGVVRNGDGTFSAWVTTDRKHFIERLVKTGLQNDGQYQILDGLQPGELAVADGAIFLSNMLEAPPTD